jgi:acetylglutamate kinase
MMDTFDYPQMGPNCIDRAVSTVSPQALMLMNDSHVHDLAEAFAGRILAMIDNQGLVDDHRTRVDLVQRLALSRVPSEQELEIGTGMLNKLELVWQGKTTEALGTYCHMVFNSASFIYVD